MLTLDKFKWLTQSYGANLERWPAETREGARALLETSATARAILAAAQLLDDAIARAGSALDSQDWGPEGAEAALARLRGRVAARIAAPGAAREVRHTSRWLSSLGAVLPHIQPGWAKLVTGGALAIAAGLTIGLLYTSSPPPQDVLFLLEPVSLPVLSDALR
jgi:hypothetical protein